MREDVRIALDKIAIRFSDDAPSADASRLRRLYVAMDAWPLDSQLGLCVLSWVLGPGFSIAGFRESVNRLVPDFLAAARAVKRLEPEGLNPTLVTLYGIARCALRNGAVVVRWNLDPETLYWPSDLADCAGATI